MTKTSIVSTSSSQRMAKVRQKNTDAELALRKELFRRGLRYRIEYVVSKKPRRTADIAFPGLKIAVFVDGCFWHGCPLHATWPKQNAEFWRKKIEANQARDLDTNSRLRDAGWTVLRFWRHEKPDTVAENIFQVVGDMKRLQEARRTRAVKTELIPNSIHETTE